MEGFRSKVSLYPFSKLTKYENLVRGSRKVVCKYAKPIGHEANWARCMWHGWLSNVSAMDLTCVTWVSRAYWNGFCASLAECILLLVPIRMTTTVKGKVSMNARGHVSVQSEHLANPF